MSVPAADNLRLSAVGLLGQHLSVVADLLEAIDALPDEAVIEDGWFIRSPAYNAGWRDAMRQVKALLHPEVQP
ncbi:MAG: hypothetical protein RL134_2702 [Actinomycetota bacterium]